MKNKHRWTHPLKSGWNPGTQTAKHKPEKTHTVKKKKEKKAKQKKAKCQLASFFFKKKQHKPKTHLTLVWWGLSCLTHTLLFDRDVVSEASSDFANVLSPEKKREKKEERERKQKKRWMKWTLSKMEKRHRKSNKRNKAREQSAKQNKSKREQAMYKSANQCTHQQKKSTHTKIFKRKNKVTNSIQHLLKSSFVLCFHCNDVNLFRVFEHTHFKQRAKSYVNIRLAKAHTQKKTQMKREKIEEKKTDKKSVNDPSVNKQNERERAEAEKRHHPSLFISLTSCIQILQINHKYTRTHIEIQLTSINPNSRETHMQTLISNVIFNNSLISFQCLSCKSLDERLVTTGRVCWMIAMRSRSLDTT